MQEARTTSVNLVLGVPNNTGIVRTPFSRSPSMSLISQMTELMNTDKNMKANTGQDHPLTPTTPAPHETPTMRFLARGMSFSLGNPGILATYSRAASGVMSRKGRAAIRALATRMTERKAARKQAIFSDLSLPSSNLALSGELIASSVAR